MASFQGFTETAIMIVIFLFAFGIVIGGMNSTFNQQNEIVGLNTDKLSSSVQDYSNSMSNKIHGGQVSFLTLTGLTLYSSWEMILSIFDITMQLVGGGWIYTIFTEYLMMPAFVGLMFQFLFIMGLGYLILKILFRVRS